MRAISPSAAPRCEYVSPYLIAPGGIHSARYKGNDIYSIQMGGTEEGYAAGGTTMQYGRFFTDTESTHHMPVVVIGEDVKKQLLPNEDPIGKWIDVDGHQLQVVGVMERPRRFPARPGRHPRAGPLLHHAQDVSQHPGAHADRHRQSRAWSIGRRTRCAPCCACRAA